MQAAGVRCLITSGWVGSGKGRGGGMSIYYAVFNFFIRRYLDQTGLVWTGVDSWAGLHIFSVPMVILYTICLNCTAYLGLSIYLHTSFFTIFVIYIYISLYIQIPSQYSLQPFSNSQCFLYRVRAVAQPISVAIDLLTSLIKFGFSQQYETLGTFFCVHGALYKVLWEWKLHARMLLDLITWVIWRTFWGPGGVCTAQGIYNQSIKSDRTEWLLVIHDLSSRGPQFIV